MLDDGRWIMLKGQSSIVIAPVEIAITDPDSSRSLL